MQKTPPEPKRYHKDLSARCEQEASTPQHFAALVAASAQPELKGNKHHLDTSSSNLQLLGEPV